MAEDKTSTTHEERIAAMRVIGESCRKAGKDAAAAFEAFIAAWKASVARDRR